MKKILIVDDSASVRAELRKLLEGAGFSVFDADGAVEGVRQVRAHPDLALLICDFNMPGANGLQMLAEVKSQNLTKAKIFMLTTEATAEMKARAKEVGVSIWITKPYDPQRLLLVIEASLK